MTKDSKVFFFIAMGLMLTMLGVGGIENSVTNYELLCGLAVSVLGLAFMWTATVMLKQVDN
jgi:hypothetical protein